MNDPVNQFITLLLGLFCLILIIILISNLSEQFAKHQNRRSNRRSHTGQHDQKSLEVALDEAVADAKKRQNKTRRYWGNPNNWIRIFTLIAVATYTGLTFWQLNILKATERRQLRGYLGIIQLAFDCGDCLPTEDDQITATSDNFGQTPLYVISGILWPNEYSIDEQFPTGNILRAPVTTSELIPQSMVVYPKNTQALNFGVNDIWRQFFWEAKYGTYWLLIRGFIRYRDIFRDEWDSLFCFIYNPTKYRKGNVFLGCPRYDKEEPAGTSEGAAMPQPTIPALPEIPSRHL